MTRRVLPEESAVAIILDERARAVIARRRSRGGDDRLFLRLERGSLRAGVPWVLVVGWAKLQRYKHYQHPFPRGRRRHRLAHSQIQAFWPRISGLEPMGQRCARDYHFVTR